MCVCVYVRIYVCVCVYVYVYIYICVCVCVCVTFSINVNSEFFNRVKIFVQRLFKMAANQIRCSRLEQRSGINFLEAEKCEKCVMCTKKHVFSKKKIFINGLLVGLPLQARVGTTVHRVETH